MAGRISDATVETLARCGHWMTVERAGECQSHSQAFLGARLCASLGEAAWPTVLFTNVRIFDGSGAAPYSGDGPGAGQPHRARGPRRLALAAGAGVTRHRRRRRDADARHGRGAHAFLVERPAGLDAIQRMPTEEHILWCAHIAKRYLDMGWTSCVGAATAKPRLDVVIRNAIDAGQIPGPRYLAASQEITVPGGLGDETLPHLPYPEFSFGAVVSGPEEMRKLRAHVPQVRRRHDQAQPVGRVHRRACRPSSRR